MSLPENAIASFQRFGCILDLSRNLIHVGWADLTPDQALAATILVRSAHRQCASGPAMCFALELSPTRALPRYYYVSFNLQDQSQLKYLTTISKQDPLAINFVGRDFEVEKQHQLISSESDELKDSLTKAIAALEKMELQYDFQKITREFESTARIPHLFERAVSEAEFAKILPVVAADMEKIPPERRALARALVRELADSVRSQEQIKKCISELPQYRDGFTLLLDVQRIFGNDYDGLIDFLGDAVAFNTEEKRLLELKKWTPNVAPILKLLNLGDSASPDRRGKALRDMGEAALALLRLIRRGRVVSLSMLQTLIPPLKPLLSSQPGRPTKDYSREYDLKKSKSWTQVARASLLENEDIREEFQGRTYDQLTLVQQQSLTNRIREGVRSYADRTGKPFPIENSPE